MALYLAASFVSGVSIEIMNSLDHLESELNQLQRNFMAQVGNELQLKSSDE